MSPSSMYVVCTQLFEKALIAMGFLRLLKNDLVLCSASHVVKQIVQAVVPRMLVSSIQQFLLSQFPIHRIIEWLGLGVPTPCHRQGHHSLHQVA